MDLTIRRAEPADLPRIAALNRAAVPAVADSTETELRRLVGQSLATLVATEDDYVVAFLLALGPGADYASPNYRFFADRYPEFTYVDRVVVAPSHQRQGIGAALYDRLEEVAGDAPLIACEVNVRPRNDTSLAFHVARGFTAVGEQDVEDGKKRVRMFVRELTG